MKRLFIVLLAGVLSGMAQQTKPLLIDAVVVDAGGRPVTGLTLSDFEITEAGSSRTVERLNRFDIVQHTSVTLGPLPALELTPDQIHPTIVFVVDDLCSSAQTLAETRRQLHLAAERILQSGGRVSILLASGGTGSAREFTADRTRINAIIGAIEYVGANVTGQVCSTAAWSTVTHALTGVHEMEGRKAVVLVSGDLPAPSAGAVMTNLAAQACAAIYQTSRIAPMLAESTGGEAGVSVDSVLDREQSYYILGFTGETGNNLRISLRRPGLTLHTRTRSISSPARFDFPAPLSGSALAERALNTPFDGSAVGMRLTVLFSNSQKEGSIVDVILHLALRDLSYVRDNKGRYRVSFELSVAGITGAGQTALSSSNPYDLEFPEQDYLRVKEQGVLLTLPVRVSTPGARQVRAAVLDSHSGRTGSASVFVDVPDLSKGALAISGIVLQGSAANRDTPGIRIFHPGATMKFNYGVYNATVDKEGRSELETQTRIFAGSQEPFSGRLTPLTFPRDADSRRQVTGTITLDPALAAGRYVLQVNVTDRLSERSRSTSQFIDFTITP
jgi:hypothetical protein